MIDILLWNQKFWHQSFVNTVFYNTVWMGWNVLLAIIPLGVAWIIFKKHPAMYQRRPWFFYPLLLVGLLFLPNAIYVFTDLIHFVDQFRYSSYSLVGVAFVLLPQYLLLVTIGIAAHWCSVSWLVLWLSGQKILNKPVQLFITLGLPALIAYGVFLGRFARFNSWDVLWPVSWFGFIKQGKLLVTDMRYLQFFALIYALTALIHFMVLNRSKRT
jgi:uncharacterized membrane protein